MQNLVWTPFFHAGQYQKLPPTPPVVDPDETLFTKTRSKAWSIVGYLPDLWSLALDGQNELIRHCGAAPQAVRIFVSAMAALNLATVVDIVYNALKPMVSGFFPLDERRVGDVEKVLTFTYLSALAALFTSVGKGGVKGLSSRASCLIDRFDGAVAPHLTYLERAWPWLSFCIRLSAVFQIHDIVVGLWLRHKLATLITQMDSNLTNDRISPNEVAGAKKIRELIRNNRSFFKRICEPNPGLKGRLKELKRTLNGADPLSKRTAVGELENMAKRCCDRSLIHIKLKAVGLAANGCAIMAATTSLVAWSVAASFCFIAKEASERASKAYKQSIV